MAIDNKHQTVITLMELHKEKHLWASATLLPKAKDISPAFPVQCDKIPPIREIKGDVTTFYEVQQRTAVLRLTVSANWYLNPDPLKASKLYQRHINFLLPLHPASAEGSSQLQ
ncbi:unnamed protein product [Natator depressus]